MIRYGRTNKIEPDKKTIEHLEKASSDLTKPHLIEFFLYFPSEHTAFSAAAEIANHGFEVQVKPGSEGLDWLCFATKLMFPELDALVCIRSKFEAIAQRFGGEYDGWGTAAVE